jgi:hypothetical protein
MLTGLGAPIPDVLLQASASSLVNPWSHGQVNDRRRCLVLARRPNTVLWPMQCPNAHGYDSYLVSFIVVSTRPPWLIVTTCSLSTCQPIQFIIGRRSTLKLTSTSSERRRTKGALSGSRPERSTICRCHDEGATVVDPRWVSF